MVKIVKKCKIVKNLFVEYDKCKKFLLTNDYIVDYNVLSERSPQHQLIVEQSCGNEVSKKLMDRNIDILVIYKEMMEKREYLFKFSDDSLLSFKSIIDGNKIVKQCISYIKVNNEVPTIDEIGRAHV